MFWFQVLQQWRESCRKGLVNRKSYSNEVAERVIVIIMKLPKSGSKSRRKIFGIAEKVVVIEFAERY